MPSTSAVTHVTHFERKKLKRTKKYIPEVVAAFCKSQGLPSEAFPNTGPREPQKQLEQSDILALLEWSDCAIALQNGCSSFALALSSTFSPGIVGLTEGFVGDPL